MSDLYLSEDWILDNVFESETTVETVNHLRSSEGTEDVIETQQQHHWNHIEPQFIQDLGLNMRIALYYEIIY